MIHFSANLLVSMLSGTRNRHNIDLSEKIFDRMTELFTGMKQSFASARVLLANTYGSNGDFSRSSNIRKEMDELGLKKQMGISKTVINGEIRVSFTMKTRFNEMKLSCSI